MPRRGLPGPWVVEETRAGEANAIVAKKNQQSQAGAQTGWNTAVAGDVRGPRGPEGIGQHRLQQEPASVPETCIQRGRSGGAPPWGSPSTTLFCSTGRAARGLGPAHSVGWGRQQGAPKGQVGCRAWMARRLQGRRADSWPGLTGKGIQREREGCTGTDSVVCTLKAS